MKKSLLLLLMGMGVGAVAHGQNPIISGQFTADPTARVFNGRMYVYPSHDIPAPIEPLKDWFCMADYHVFSSDNLTDWTDHGVIISQESVPWVAEESYAMWAPDCVCKEGKYYFYFPAAPKGVERGFGIGMAVADNPAGPFTPMDKPIEGIFGIDPCVLVDNDGSSYIYWSAMGIRAAKLGADMNSLDSEPVQIQGLPEGFKEGPFAFKRNGIYYLTFPWVRDKTETLAYAIADNPFGPFEFKGVIMDESPTECWTNHHSIVEYDGQWYLFYHHNDYSPQMDKRRSTRADYLTFNEDGTINKVVPTLRGVGVVDAYRPIQVDRYSTVSDSGSGSERGGASIDFIDPTDKFKGWYLTLAQGGWSTFDRVKFGKDAAPTSVRMMVRAPKGATVEIEIVSDGKSQTIASVEIPKSKQWTMISAPINSIYGGANAKELCDGSAESKLTGIQNIKLTCSEGSADIDYIIFDGRTASAGTVDNSYFTQPTTECSEVDSEGFIRRWWLLDPIDKPNRTNTVFTDSYLKKEFYKTYFPDQFQMVPREGQTEKVGTQKLQWDNVESTGYNVQLYRYASTGGKQVYGVLFWAVTIVECDEEIHDVRLAVGSNSASMWWLDGHEVLTLSGDRRMVMDDGMSHRLTLHKGRNILRGAVINGPGMSNFCVRFLDSNGAAVKNIKICKE